MGGLGLILDDLIVVIIVDFFDILLIERFEIIEDIIKKFVCWGWIMIVSNWK